MILKGSQRGNGGDLAVHLLNKFDNDSVEIAEVYGTVSDELYGAFAEFEAVAAGTKATKPLYSLSINPSAPLTREQYHEAIQEIEHGLGLTDQPRAVVFHVKDGREHCHVVWSRIDGERMRAIHMSHDHSRLCDLACKLAHRYGLELPQGLKDWEAKQRHKDELRLEPTFAERAQQKETGITPEERRAEITAAYEQSDSAAAFRSALEDKGYVLACGRRNAFVIVDRHGGVHKLSRYIDGQSAKQIKARLLPLTPQQLPSVDDAKEAMRQRQEAQQAKLDNRQQDKRQLLQDRIEQELREREEDLAAQHAERRAALRDAEQELLIRHQHERLSLHAAQKSESSGVLFRARTAVADLIAKTPGLRAVLAPINRMTGIDPRLRQVMEREALARRHEREKVALEGKKRALARQETREKAGLRRLVTRELSSHIAREWARDNAHHLKDHAKQEFIDAARDQKLWQRRAFQRGDMQKDFNDAAEFVEGAHRDEEGGEDRAPKRRWSSGTRQHEHGQRMRKGRGFRRDGD